MDNFSRFLRYNLEFVFKFKYDVVGTVIAIAIATTNELVHKV